MVKLDSILEMKGIFVLLFQSNKRSLLKLSVLISFRVRLLVLSAGCDFATGPTQINRCKFRMDDKSAELGDGGGGGRGRERHRLQKSHAGQTDT